MHARRQGFEFLIDEGGRSFDQDPRLLFGAPVQLIEKDVEPLTALLFEVRGIACSQVPEMGDNIFFCRQAVLAQCLPHQRLQDLLCPASADAENKFERGAINEGVRQVFELLDDLVEAVVPERFVWQGVPATLLKDRADAT